MGSDETSAAGEAGQGAVSRRAVLGASIGGIGAASVVGLATAAMWPETKVTAATAGSVEAETVEAGDATTAAIDFTAAPDDDFEARDPRLDPAPSATEHRIDLRATELAGEVAPGVSQQLWTFNDVVPAPFFRGKLGDRFVFTLTNDGTLDHSVDFHASKVAWSGPMQSIGPGESVEYAFEAKHAGVFMFHCGTPPVLHHIGAGMHGAVVIDPPDLAAVDHELLMIQSEIYTGPDGEVADYPKMQRSAWDAVVFNGYVNQYKHRPIRVEVHERVRVWVQNNGPSENSSFHVIGTIADTVFKEGAYRLRPDAGRGGSQALDLQPAQGGFIEFTFDEEGFYPFVTHKFATAEIGALGLFQVGDVELPAGGAGH
ncbi:MAG: multicopper oxidase domain-containing protein [Acidimicrobiales bacterium]|nr:multicopper oxidase domain-containing protein [Acidimicrobiales bacterium]